MIQTSLFSVLAALASIVIVGACTSVPQKPEASLCPCPPKPETARYEQTTFDALPGWASAQLEPSLRAFLAGCPRLSGPLASACQLAAAVRPGEERLFLESTFVPYALISSETGATGLITGYYEPIVEASRTQNALNRFPIFGVPDDLIVVDLAAVNPDLRNQRLRGRLEGRRVVPYYSRAEIETKGASFVAPVIAWASDPVELFFLQIQGSGQLKLDSGERMRVAFADQNGHPYRSLGRYLVDRGELTLEQASMQGIKSWAVVNPQKLQDALNYNASYVFFRELPPAAESPIGALGVPLSAGYSLAIDRRFVPLGAPVYLASSHPLSAEPLERLMAAQDTGGAIRGVVRADFFWGT